MPTRPNSTLLPLSPLAGLALLLGVVAAPLLAYNLTPSATLFNQLLALGGAGLLLSCLGMQAQGPRVQISAAACALILLVLAAGASWQWNGLPASLAMSAAALTGTALLLLLAGQGLAGESRQRWFEALCWALLAAGALSFLVSLVQVFLPTVPDGKFIARSGIVGRAVGNMRQPNHLASLLMWSCVAAVYLADRGRLKALPVWLFGFVFAVVLSASRTGMVGVLILAVWGALDRKLSRATRFALLATPLMLAFSWWGMSLWAASGEGHTFGAQTRLDNEGAGSDSRLLILANAWELVKRNPLTGVGWGEFNLAWTMTPFPARPIAFFDHTHDLPMQLAVELGLPLALLICGLLCWSLWRAFRASMRETRLEQAVVGRCATLLVVMIGLHSLLEYPLWYAYFLLPAAFAFGLALADGKPEEDEDEVSTRQATAVGSRLLAAAGALIFIGSIYAVFDYQKVVAIYVPSEDAAPLPARIAAGQNSLFFSALADYAAATSTPPGAAALAAAQRTGHNLIDARLLIAWAKSLHAVGDDDRARYVVARLKEFRHPLGDEFLAICAEEMPEAAKPFQCAPPSRDYEWREIREPRR